MSDPHDSVFILLAWVGFVGVTFAGCIALYLTLKDRRRRIARRDARRNERAAARSKGKRRG